MRKKDWQKARNRLEDSAKAGASYWRRMHDDPDFTRRLDKIRAEYDLPLDFDIRIESARWIDWLGLDDTPGTKATQRGRAFMAEMRALFTDLKIPAIWHDEIIAETAGRYQYQTFPPMVDLGTLRIVEGRPAWQLTITPETDLTNPAVLELMQQQQKAHAGEPPAPVQDKAGHGRLDWGPVYEWSKSHPLFTIEELAKKIGYTSQYIREKFSELAPKPRTDK
jgi:hypothetical protein